MPRGPMPKGPMLRGAIAPLDLRSSKLLVSSAHALDRSNGISEGHSIRGVGGLQVFILAWWLPKKSLTHVVVITSEE
jgi:hypothetical protein